MKNKNIVIAIIVFVIFVGIIAIVSYFYFKPKEEKKIPININMQQLNNDIYTQGGFSEMRMTDIDSSDMLSTTFAIDDKDAVQEYIGKVPLVNITSSMYVVIKVNDGKADYVLSKLDAYAKNYEEEWSSYLTDQYDLVKQRQIGIKGNYVYLIISNNAKELVSLIK